MPIDPDAKYEITGFKWVPDFARGFVRETRARWAFEEVGLSYKVRLIDFDEVKSQAQRHFQPFGQVPTYSDGDVEIFESGAIAIRIAEQRLGLMPLDMAGRAHAIQWVIAALNSVEPFVAQLSVVDLFEADKPWSAERRPSVVETIRSRLHDLSEALGDKQWLDGNFSVGDLIMVSVLRELHASGLLKEFPNLAAYVARGEARPAYQRAMADHLATFQDAGPTPPLSVSQPIGVPA
ncbi:MAG: glutathione S-transferase family protein [Sphingomonas sp.]|uniref:glutathione S-transferase family protein n=1 Tax=Sphingomonas sp. TaxID=28214 RepID=UPI0017AF76DA|nr:glutathione S-transferase family protein [Sphingomonas sp.]MBA3667137.1 glutathione S-transferase family protein [Sphingomonas sp.]